MTMSNMTITNHLISLDTKAEEAVSLQRQIIVRDFGNRIEKQAKVAQY